MWTTHNAKVYPSIVMGDQASLELIALLRFKYNPGAPATRYHPADGYQIDAIEVVELHIDHGAGKRTPLPLTAELCEWIVEKADEAALAEAAADDADAAADEAAEYRHQANVERRLEALAADCGD